MQNIRQAPSIPVQYDNGSSMVPFPGNAWTDMHQMQCTFLWMPNASNWHHQAKVTEMDEPQRTPISNNYYNHTERRSYEFLSLVYTVSCVRSCPTHSTGFQSLLRSSSKLLSWHTRPSMDMLMSTTIICQLWLVNTAHTFLSSHPNVGHNFSFIREQQSLSNYIRVIKIAQFVFLALWIFEVHM